MLGISSVFYGVLSPGTSCAEPVLPVCTAHAARWVVEQACMHRNSCDVAASDELFDPTAVVCREQQRHQPTVTSSPHQLFFSAVCGHLEPTLKLSSLP